MRKLVRGSVILLAAMVVLATGASGARKMATVKASSGALNTAIFFTPLSSTADNATELERIQAAGAKYTAIHVYWSQIAPSGTTKPDGFQADDPADSNYKWAGTDNQVTAAVAAGLKPMVFITQAPEWAEGSGIGPQDQGSHKPSPSELAKFVTAAATRYSGSFDDLPRVQYWAIWNEPNLNTFLDPQVVNKKAFSPTWYRSMLNTAADAIHGVNAANVVIGGETAPFGKTSATRNATRPITFMENVLCVKEKKVVNKKTKAVTYTYKASCKTKTKVDVWSHHPYTQGGPTMKSPNHGNASLGDMGEMRSVLNAAIKANHVVSSQKPRLWVTEFSWDSKPPDPGGVPIALETRWVSQMLYQMRISGVSLVSWFLLRDDPLESTPYQSGLYYRGSDISSDRAKPILRAFRFPFVAMPQTVKGKTTVTLWGRTPAGKSGQVLIESKSGSNWKKVKTLSADSFGIFKARIAKPAGATSFKALLSDGSDQSAAFALKAPKKSWHGGVFGFNT
jgi:hypothetical protein